MHVCYSSQHSLQVDGDTTLAQLCSLWRKAVNEVLDSHNILEQLRAEHQATDESANRLARLSFP